MYPQTALQARDYLKAQTDCDFIEFSIVRDCHGSTPYLYAKTKENEWVIAWHPDELAA